MNIPTEILAHFNVPKRNDSSKASCLVKTSVTESKKSGIKKPGENSLRKKPNMKAGYYITPARRGRKSGGIFATHHEISSEEWEGYRKNAAKIGNPLSRKEANERKKARIALVNKYSGGTKTSKVRDYNPKPKRKAKAMKQKTPTVKLGTYSYARSKTRERIYGTRKAIVMTKKIQKTFPNIFDRQAMK